MNALNEVIAKFEPIQLEGMERVKLMDRVDTKYVFPSADLPAILEKMKPDYRLLDIDTIRIHRYESLYFDTDDFLFYSKHQAGKLNRHKFRFRRYVDSGGLTYFEIKFKNNKSRTVKERVKIKDGSLNITGKAELFLKSTTPYAPEILVPKMWVNYSRMTFVNRSSYERITVDTNLHYIKADDVNQMKVNFPQMVIAEVKRDKVSSVSPFIRIIRELGVREGAISKYCFGVYNLFPDLKSNNFKPRVRFINKMTGMNFLPTGT